MSDPETGWRILNWVWERKDEVGRKLADLAAWFRGKKEDDRGILIIGPGGTGKTTLARILSGEYDWLKDSPWEYRESASVESYGLSDDPKTQLVVPPGQSHRRGSTWADLQTDLAVGRYRGVILLAAYGYHNLSQSYKVHPLYKGNKAEFLDAYLADCQADERRLLDHIGNAIRICPKKMWLFTIVTKQDLWVSSEAAVVEYYTQGGWRDAITGLAVGKGPRLFRSELLFASLVICNFDSPAAERLRKNTEGYDQKAQIEKLRRVFEVLDALRRWEEGS